MKRMQVMFGKRRAMVLVTLVVLVLAAAALIASSANFTATSQNTGNIFTAGNLKHVNSLDTAAIITMDKMKPTDFVEGDVTLTNDGDIPAAFTLTKTITANVAGLTGGNFATKLDLEITEAGAPIWTGKIGAAMGTINLGTFAAAPAAGSSHTYHFKVTFPDGGPGGADNVYKQASTTARFDWESASN
jgi:hypothetical protein